MINYWVELDRLENKFPLHIKVSTKISLWSFSFDKLIPIGSLGHVIDYKGMRTHENDFTHVCLLIRLLSGDLFCLSESEIEIE